MQFLQGECTEQKEKISVFGCHLPCPNDLLGDTFAFLLLIGWSGIGKKKEETLPRACKAKRKIMMNSCCENENRKSQYFLLSSNRVPCTLW